MYLNSVIGLSNKIFGYSSILRPSRYILAFKRPKFQITALFWVKGCLKSSSECYESIFGSTNFPVCNLAFPATIAAFLAFMAMKLKNNEIMALLTPNKPKTTKKSKNFTFLALWPLVRPLRPLLAFFQFSWNPWCLRSPVVWKNIISKQEIIKNNFQTRFSISVQCVRTEQWITIIMNKKFAYLKCTIVKLIRSK